MTDRDDRDPIADAAETARENPGRGSQSAGGGLGPGAGEDAPASVTAPPDDRSADEDDVTVTPTLRGVPKREPRPDVRSSQLDRGQEG